MIDQYFEATDESALELFSRNITGEVIMLNLLRFREFAEYKAYPELAPEQPITGRFEITSSGRASKSQHNKYSQLNGFTLRCLRSQITSNMTMAKSIG
jgi:hypothetical protein